MKTDLLNKISSQNKIKKMKTIRQIAEEVGVSKTAIRKKLTEDIRNQFTETIGNVVYISEKGENLIKSAFNKSVENHVSANQTETVSELVSALKAELDIKNKQISDLSSALVLAQEQASTAQQSLLASQALHGETVKLLIGSKEEVSVDDIEAEKTKSANPHEKRKFMGGIFGKKKGNNSND